MGWAWGFSSSEKIKLTRYHTLFRPLEDLSTARDLESGFDLICENSSFRNLYSPIFSPKKEWILRSMVKPREKKVPKGPKSSGRDGDYVWATDAGCCVSLLKNLPEFAKMIRQSKSSSHSHLIGLGPVLELLSALIGLSKSFAAERAKQL